MLANLTICYFSIDSASTKKFNNAVNSLFQNYKEDPDTVKRHYSEYLSFTENQLKILDEAIKRGDYTYEIAEPPNRYAPAGYIDEQFYEILFTAINFEDSYNAKISAILNEAHGRLIEYQYLGIEPTTFSYRLQTIIISQYESLKDTVSFPVIYTHGWDTYFSYSAINIFIFIALSVAIVIIFTQDSTSGINLLLNTTKYGKFHYIVAKILSICIICFLTVFIFRLTTWGLLNFSIGFSYSLVPIQMLDGFELCPFLISINEYMVISFFYNTFAFTILMLSVAAISVVLQNTILSFLSSLLILGGQVVTHALTIFSSSSYVKVFDFISSLEVNEYFFEYHAINISGIPVNFLTFLSIVYAILFFIFVVIVSIKYVFYSLPYIPTSIRRKIHHSNDQDCSRFGKPTTLHHKVYISCFTAEMYKLLISSRFAILIIGLLVCKTFLSLNSVPSSDTYDELIYKNYIYSISGSISESSEEFIKKERFNIDNILSQQTTMQQLFLHKEITYSEYREYLSEYRAAYSKNPILSSVEKYMRYIKEQLNSGHDAWIVYDSGWNSLFFNLADWTQYIALILLLSGIFASEYVHTASSYGFASILRTTRFGRERTFICKYLAASIITIIVSILWNAIDFIIISSRFKLDFFSAPIHSLEAFSNYKSNFSIGNYLIYFYLLKILSSLLLSSIICSISVILHKTLPVVTSISFVLLLPSALSYLQIMYLDKIDFINFLRVTPLVLQNTFAYIYIIFNLLLCFYLYKYAKKKWNYC